jgi:hypothetical protein
LRNWETTSAEVRSVGCSGNGLKRSVFNETRIVVHSLSTLDLFAR